ncbi:hypothetical protein [Pseudomonas palmensis]|uniref:hypothetical protein n=1 Tax=Pseudomonas palmensis TaxID=2815362 RepID=UPI0039EAC10A
MIFQVIFFRRTAFAGKSALSWNAITVIFKGVDMQMHEAVELVEAQSVEEADELLEAGWKLLAVISGQRWVSGESQIGPIYILGKK